MTLATLFVTSTYAQVQDDSSDTEESQEYEASEDGTEIEEEEAPGQARRVEIGNPPPRRERINPYGGRENETRAQTYCRYLNTLQNSPQKRGLLVHHNCL